MRQQESFISGKKKYFFLLLYMLDAVAFIASMHLAFTLLGYTGSRMAFCFRVSILSLLILVVNYSAFGLYDDKRKLIDEAFFIGIFYSLLITYIILLVFALVIEAEFLVMALSAGFLLSLAITVIIRHGLYNVIYYLRDKGYDQRKIFFFGKNNHELINKINESSYLGYRYLGHTSSQKKLKKIMGDCDIIFITEDKISSRMIDIMTKNSRINWKIIPSAFNLIIDRVSFDEFKDYPVINISSSSVSNNYMHIKRAIDLAASGISLILLSPLFLAVAILIKVTMPGPVFFRQERLGIGLKPFLLYKFRTMVVGADKMKVNLVNEADGLFKKKNDPRVTPLGRILRRACIDELPQLINIFKGDMSLVGPRPHLKSELSHFKGWRHARFHVKPGLTGLWQVNGRHDLNFDKAVLYDIYYVKHFSLLMDASIILKTLPAIIFNKGKY